MPVPYSSIEFADTTQAQPGTGNVKEREIGATSIFKSVVETDLCYRTLLSSCAEFSSQICFGFGCYVS